MLIVGYLPRGVSDRTFIEQASGEDVAQPALAVQFVREGNTVIVHLMDRLARHFEDLRRLDRELASPCSGKHVIEPILAGVHSPRRGRKPATWTPVDRDYEKIRIDMQTLFQDLGIHTAA